MAESGSESKASWFAVLFARRSRRGWWVYVFWSLAYLPVAASYADYLAFWGVGPALMWPLLFPIFIVVLQWIRPTAIGWIAILLPTLIYTCACVYTWFAHALGPHQQWAYELAGAFWGIVALAVLFGLCAGLIVAARPRPPS